MEKTKKSTKDICSKVSSLALYVVFGISALVLILFFCVGYNNMESYASGFLTTPKFTDLLLFWQYALVVICIILTIVGAIIARGAKIDSQMPKSAGVLKTLGLLLFVPLLIVGAIIGSSKPVRTGEGIYDNSFWLVATDAMLYTIYGLLIVVVVGLILNMIGIFKK
ncbi:MAG: hypothetical protein J5698_03255 [Bacteroidaceae bacterium]|nr:hypothetical protein [Bacteroidaceae bacterium]MBO4589974.1 hypothetical protein [Bacteroidaceae bacterium]